MRIDIRLSCPVFNSFRVQQIAGMFDVPLAEKLREEFSIEIPDELLRSVWSSGCLVPGNQTIAARQGTSPPDTCQPDTRHPSWQLGLIVGPSGSGKTTLARRLFGKDFIERMEWPADRAVIDCFEFKAEGGIRKAEREADAKADSYSLPYSAFRLPPSALSIQQITKLLTAVGFSSPPSWIKPYHVLSGGERFRCDLARALAGVSKAEGGIGKAEEGHAEQSESPSASRSAFRLPNSALPLVAFDEFTSVVDRNVARIGSAAVAKAIRSGQIRCRFVAVTCHYDILEWLAPDWVIDMATREFAWCIQAHGLQPVGLPDGAELQSFLPRRRLRRPPIELHLYRCHHSLWKMFARHHYLSGSLSRAARCYVAMWENSKAEGGRGKAEENSVNQSASMSASRSAFRIPPSAFGVPVSFCATLPVVGKKNHWRISRIVTLPDYQGVGIGMRVVEAVADLHRQQGHRLNVTASHPSLIAHCRRSPKWRVVQVMRTGNRRQRGIPTYRGSTGRAVVSFEYEGSP